MYNHVDAGNLQTHEPEIYVSSIVNIEIMGCWQNLSFFRTLLFSLDDCASFLAVFPSLNAKCVCVCASMCVCVSVRVFLRAYLCFPTTWKCIDFLWDYDMQWTNSKSAFNLCFLLIHANTSFFEWWSKSSDNDWRQWPRRQRGMGWLVQTASSHCHYYFWLHCYWLLLSLLPVQPYINSVLGKQPND